MEAQDLIPHRAALIGAALALAAGVTGGLILKTGPQTAPEAYSEIASSLPQVQAEPIGWSGRGTPPDYVVGTDFLVSHDAEPPPVVMASYEVPVYTPPAPTPALEPPPVQPVRMVETETPAWPSTHGDILDTRLPEDPPQAPSARQALAAVAAPVAMAVAY